MGGFIRVMAGPEGDSLVEAAVRTWAVLLIPVPVVTLLSCMRCTRCASTHRAYLMLSSGRGISSRSKSWKNDTSEESEIEGRSDAVPGSVGPRTTLLMHLPVHSIDFAPQFELCDLLSNFALGRFGIITAMREDPWI